MAKTGKKQSSGWDGKIKKIWDVELWATDTMVHFLMLVPGWAMRFQVLGSVSERLKSHMLWEKRAGKLVR